MSSAASAAYISSSNVAAASQIPSPSAPGKAVNIQPDQETPEATTEPNDNIRDSEIQVDYPGASEIPIGRAGTTNVQSNESELPALTKGSIDDEEGDVEVLRNEIPDSEDIPESSSPRLSKEEGAEIGGIEEPVVELPSFLSQSLKEPELSKVAETYPSEVLNVEPTFKENEEVVSAAVSSSKTVFTEAVAVESSREGLDHTITSPDNILQIGRPHLTSSEVYDELSTPMSPREEEGGQMDHSASPATELAKAKGASLEPANTYFTEAPSAIKDSHLTVTVESSPTRADESAMTRASSSGAIDVEFTEASPLPNNGFEPAGCSFPTVMEDHRATLATQIVADDLHPHDVPEIQTKGERLPSITPSSNYKNEQKPLPLSLPELTRTPVPLSFQSRANITHPNIALSSPQKPGGRSTTQSNTADSLNKSFTAAEGSPSKDILIAELKVMKIASIQARNASLEAEIASKQAKLAEIAKDLENPAAETVRRHIKLLHDYNDIRDVGQGLIGMIADNRGVRIGELYGEFGVGLQD